MDYRIDGVLIEIEDNLSRIQTAQSFAKTLNVSVSRFQHLFKQEVGRSFTNHIKDLRLRKASELLAAGNLTVKEIMAKVGAKDESHFLRDFKCRFGETPTDYRKNLRRIAKTATK